MEFDVVVVLVLALLFWGGIAYLVFRERRMPQPEESANPAPAQEESRPADGRKKTGKPPAAAGIDSRRR